MLRSFQPLRPTAPTASLWTGWLAACRRWQAAALTRRALRQARRHQARQARAAQEACAVEGAVTEFGVVELNGRRFGALYVDGRLSCLLPDVDRL